MIYCVSDIHGEYDMFMELLKKINFSEADTLYVMGDVFDRGPHPVKVLQEMMKHDNIIPLVGNHELMGVPSLKFLMQEITEENVDDISDNIVMNILNWQMNGSATTINEFRELSEEEQTEIFEYLGSFEAYEELSVGDRSYILVHAGIGNFSPDKLMEDYDLQELVWTRPDYEKQYFDDVYVVSGHTPTQLIKQNSNGGYIYRANNHIAIDCGACFEGGRLAAICLDTDEEFYVERADDAE